MDRTPAPLLTDADTPDRSSLSLELEPGEFWWGGTVKDGVQMPFGATSTHRRDLGVPQHDPEWDSAEDSSQAAPVLVSTRGRVVSSPHPFAFSVADGRLDVDGRDLTVLRSGTSLREGYRAASAQLFPPAGRTPARRLFASPQYNTWIETPLTPSEESVLAYARRILDAGLEPGTLFIDDNWAPDFGTWRFDLARFPDPERLISTLADWGFPVMLWVVPFISPDSAAFRDCERDGLLVRNADGRTAIRRWWNGFSALLDLSNPTAVAWLTDQFDALVDIGVAGFKFDAGDVRDYFSDDRIAQPCEPVDMSERWARLGLRYEYNEYRACWRMGGQPLGQRLRDKPPTWDDAGLGSLVPEMLAQGLMGHPYVCPDMVGGGEVGAMGGRDAADQEFFVRYAQIAALSPMIQFSVNPARALDGQHLAAVKDALAIRTEHLPLILSLVDDAALTGEPVLRPMSYHEEGYETVTDHFFLGPDLLVAPVVERGATARTMHVPPGSWSAPDGTTYEGPATIEVPVDLTTLPRLSRATSGAAPR
ncbi:glycoside hydrolase family 31 protein [Serinibacter arcticus]|uniref:Alpha-glucosidase n=1 Tax=Serinibacter arcticus TaxID=1655435 RepID=A0A4Z1E3U7_9MICO|nr:glycoside hydrolase family 31 protein [Serinibacter arcticus]TGO05143.1 Alpha-glucosidase [Serinibacter arcticus]